MPVEFESASHKTLHYPQAFKGQLFIIITALLLISILPQPCEASYISPQTQALTSLRADSTTPVSIKARNGFPGSITLDVSAEGNDSLDSALIFLDNYAPLYLLNHPDVTLNHIMTQGNPEGHEIVRLGQTFRGFQVFGAELVVHLLQNAVGGPPRIRYTSGSLMNPYRSTGEPPLEVDIDTVPAITAERAEAVVLSEINFPADGVVGETKLMIYDPSLFGEGGGPRLVWRVSLGPCTWGQFLVDAHNAQILFQHEFAQPDGYWLDQADLDIEDANGGNVRDTNCFNPTTLDDKIGNALDIDDEYNQDVDAFYAWWSARETYRVFHDTFGRHSFDDDNSELSVYVHAVLPPKWEPNALAQKDCGIEFSEGFVGLDAVAHEFTHLVTYSTSNLVYKFHSGALNESFSDIMGTVVDPLDWLHGEDRTGGGGTVRSLADPRNGLCGPTGDTHACNQPDRFSEYVPMDENTDNGGVHTNCGIINKAFYLMSEGGTFNGQTVSPMGFEKMYRLAYQVFTHLPSNAQFWDARHDAVCLADLSAMGGNWGLGGFTPADACTVRNAFRAVEIGCGDQDCDGIEEFCHDTDEDGVLDGEDNCVEDPNPDQVDIDTDGTGDACDEDNDNDGFPDAVDPCWNIPNDFGDPDGDHVPNCLDDDDDGDGILDDGDGSGNPGWEADNPCPSGVTVNCDDNCRTDSNPDQFDCNGDRIGDACDIIAEFDGDGFCGPDDNCPFVPNSDQSDTDGDGLGDACDRCPEIDDNTQAYLPGIPALGIPPRPYQPDSDGDGIPDACDERAFFNASLVLGGVLYNPLNRVRPDGQRKDLELKGTLDGGDLVRMPIVACPDETGPVLGANERLEIFFTGLPPDTVSLWIEDDGGSVTGRVRPNITYPSRQGVRFKPRCTSSYTLCFRTEPGFSGQVLLSMTYRVIDSAVANPYASPGIPIGFPPPPLPDADRDGLLDSIDLCPEDYDPVNLDREGDGVGDVCDPDDDNDGICDPGESGPLCSGSDNCPFDPENDIDNDSVCADIDNCPTDYNPDQLDTYPPPGNDIGDACDCESDFNCDGNVDATDVTSFLGDFGRSTFFNPCTNSDSCNGDVDCNGNVDAADVNKFLEDFGRSQFFNPCPACVVGNWCVY